MSNSSRFSWCSAAALLIYVTVGFSVAAEKPEAASPPAQVVKGFLEAIRKGNAAGVKQAVARPTSREQQEGFDRWVALTIQMSGKLEPELKPVTDSKIAGDFAVVRGGYSNKPYMRLRKGDGTWKILAPADPKVTYGMNAMDALNLSSLEKWADREWNDEPAPAPQPANAEKKEPDPQPVPADEPAMTTDSAKLNPAVAEVFPVLLDLLPKLTSAQMPVNFHDQVIQALLKAGDFASAQKLLEAYPRSQRGETVKGEVYAALPGGIEGAQARAKFERGLTSGAYFGAAITSARHGDVAGAFSLMKKEGVSDPRKHTRMLSPVLTAKELHAAMGEQVNDPWTLVDDAAYRIYVCAGADDNANVEKLLAAMRDASDTAELKWRIGDHEVLEVERSLVYGYLSRADFASAKKVIDDRFDVMMKAAEASKDRRSDESSATKHRLDLYRIMIAIRAHHGDFDGAVADFDRIKGAYGADTASLPLAFAYAKAGRMTVAEALVPSKPSPSGGWLEQDQAIALGLIAAAAFERGDAELAVASAGRAIKLSQAAPDDRRRAQLATAFLSGVAYGPIAAVYPEMFRLRTYCLAK